MLKPKFETGQHVCAVGVKTKAVEVPRRCEMCNSTGKLEIKGKGIQICPYCNGRTELTSCAAGYEIQYYTATIGAVCTEEYHSKYKKKSKITYLLDETGVLGGGSIWNENMLFESVDEARTFCQKYDPDPKTFEPILKEME